MTRSAHALTACLLAVLAVPTFTQGARKGDAVAAYRALVTDYRHFGRTAVDRLRNIPAETLQVAIATAESAPPAGWDWPDLRGAAMLHTEVWYVGRNVRGSSEAAFHLATAERLLGAVTAREPQQRYFAERWCRTVAELLRSDNSAASNVKERCARRWPLSPPEARARSEYETTVRSEAMFFSTVEARLYARDGNFRAQPDILRFVDLYNTVLSEDPRYAPAALRLGNLGQHWETTRSPRSPLHRPHARRTPETAISLSCSLGESTIAPDASMTPSDSTWRRCGNIRPLNRQRSHWPSFSAAAATTASRASC